MTLDNFLELLTELDFDLFECLDLSKFEAAEVFSARQFFLTAAFLSADLTEVFAVDLTVGILNTFALALGFIPEDPKTASELTLFLDNHPRNSNVALPSLIWALHSAAGNLQCRFVHKASSNFL